MIKWMFIIVIALSLSGCADVADAEDTPTTSDSEQQQTRTADASATTWIAVVLRWRPINRVIDKEFSTEVACWNYYENGIGDSKFGPQVLDHQNNPPTKEYNFGPDYLEYPIRIYRGLKGEGQVWLTCDIKDRYEGL